MPRNVKLVPLRLPIVIIEMLDASEIPSYRRSAIVLHIVNNFLAQAIELKTPRLINQKLKTKGAERIVTISVPSDVISLWKRYAENVEKSVNCLVTNALLNHFKLVA
jgi:hypothetical protein